MPVVSALAGGIYAAAHGHLPSVGASTASNFWIPKSETDSSYIGGTFFFGTRENTVKQFFARKFAAINFKIERQMLHRHDIRELVELTVMRMEILHLVGALMLEFCMGWYIHHNTMWNLPVWYSNMWMISNFSAVGYLILCVWLSMYATIASRSIGTRMLTSQLRLSIPTQAELDEIKVPIFFNAKDAVRKALRRSNSDPELNSTRAIAFDPEDDEGCLAETETCCFPGEDRYTEVASEDDQQHFRAFLNHLPRWLMYDTWARVCFSFGMAQMLQALGYFSLGALWSNSPMTGVLSFAAVQILSTIILWLDIGDLNHSLFEYSLIVCLNFVPDVIVLGLLATELVGEAPRFLAGILVCACFWAQAGWLWYLNCMFQTAGAKHSRYQPGNYANVLEWIRAGRSKKKAFRKRSSMTKFFVHYGMSTCVEERLAEEAGAMGFTNPKKDPSRRPEINGGSTPGLWARPLRDLSFGHDYETLNTTQSLPVRMVLYFTLTCIVWWLLSGVIHGLLITSLGWRQGSAFFGNEEMGKESNNFHQHYHFAHTHYAHHGASLHFLNQMSTKVDAHIHLDEASAVYCGDSQVWVSDSSAVYSMVHTNDASPWSLRFVRHADLSAVICGSHGCDALSRGAGGHGPWVMGPMEHSGSALMQVPIPLPWRLVTGGWTSCPSISNASCSSARLVGWDGAHVFAADLDQNADSKNWSFHKRFQVDPIRGLCDGRIENSSCRQEAEKRYTNVNALHLSRQTLMVLLDGGDTDVWDLSSGMLVSTLQLGDRTVSMCQSGKRLYVSRDTDTGPFVETVDMPQDLLRLPQSDAISLLSVGRPLRTGSPAQHPLSIARDALFRAVIAFVGKE